MRLLAKLFGTKNDREIKALWPRVQAITALEPQVSTLSDEGLRDRILALKAQISAEMDEAEKQAGELSRDQYNAILDPHLHEVFAIVREAGKRVLNMRHFDVQLLGGMVLHSGKIAEMKTGEGKTLVATLPAVFNALSGRGVHVVTVNDYLASRDAEWMGRIYRFLGLKVGVVLPNTSDRVKQEAYLCDITYGQNNEFGFDYLRDNMKFGLADYVQRGHNFAIVDEVDSILIDEARTPLIISGPAEDSSEKYKQTNSVVPRLRKDVDYAIDEKARVVMLTESGIEKAESLLGIENLYDPINLELLHHLNQALRAHTLFKRDIDYVIERGEVVIVDEHTGRLMHGRRWSDGLHQAVEAKENVQVQAENQTLATITFQNYFRMYKKLSGMTGTADTEAEEFAKIYDLDVIVIPPNRPISRIDGQDQVYKTEREKFEAVAQDIASAHTKGQPVLVGTVSVEKSEILSRRLKQLNIPHHVLNAKKHRDEAGIVAQAGRLGAVTIATNMAGRGTDIILGGDPEFMARTEVAKEFDETREQVAEFGFLTGRPDLITIENLARRDQTEGKYLFAIEEELKAERAKEEEAKAKGEPYTPPVSLPRTFEEAQARIYQERLAFYQKAVAAYAEHLKTYQAICAAEKEKVMAAGGLKIVGTERHESRRIDNQLRGRSGRQGDVGSSIFYLSLQDDLMRIFGSDRMIGIMERLGMKDGEPIEHPLVSKSIANAQKRVEGFHFDSRKQLIEYDDVMNQQRQAIYGLRRKVLGGSDIRDLLFDLVEQAIISMVTNACPEKTGPSEWKLGALSDELYNLLGVRVDLRSFHGDRQDLMDLLYRSVDAFYTQKESTVDPQVVRQVERFVYLQAIDRLWKEHLQAMDHLREGIHFQGYAQKDPKQEYKKEGFNLFFNMMAYLRDEVLERAFKAEIRLNTEQQVQRDFELMQENFKRQQEQLQKQQQVRHENPAQAKQPRMPAPASVPGELPEFYGQRPSIQQTNNSLNRQQRRLVKSQERKNKK